ncbi:MAG: hypothetical protein RLZZ524_759 [Pseudomonadota bacterium]|jgi:hypothetical protein
MSDIVERLESRASAARREMTGTALGDALHFEEARDEIVRLRAENDVARNLVASSTNRRVKAEDRAEAAEAERDRLREALVGVLGAYHLDGDGQPPCFGRPSIRRAWDAARAALKGDTPG